MATPYIEELALESKNNEAISEVFTFLENVGTEEVPDMQPMNMTGRQFFSQARTSKSLEGDLMCQIVVTIEGDPLDGQLRFSVSEQVLKDVPPLKGHYDVLTRVGNAARIDNLYQAPFIVGQGITDATQWT